MNMTNSSIYLCLLLWLRVCFFLWAWLQCLKFSVLDSKCMWWENSLEVHVWVMQYLPFHDFNCGVLTFLDLNCLNYWVSYCVPSLFPLIFRSRVHFILVYKNVHDLWFIYYYFYPCCFLANKLILAVVIDLICFTDLVLKNENLQYWHLRLPKINFSNQFWSNKVNSLWQNM